MEERKNELWTGGSWEHPEEAFPAPPPVVIPEPPRRKKKKRKKKGRRIPWFGVFILVIFMVALAVAALRGALYADGAGGSDGPGESYVNESTDPPRIEKAPTGSGLTIGLEEKRGTPLTYAQL